MNRLQRRKYGTYENYLLSDHWQDVRRRFYLSKLWKGHCYCCKQSSRQIHIHHRTYNRLGKERLLDLVAICANCHKVVHEILKRRGGSSTNLWNVTQKLRKVMKKRGWITARDWTIPTKNRRRRRKKSRARRYWDRHGSSAATVAEGVEYAKQSRIDALNIGSS